jgi:hypothetical protein
MAAIEKVDLTGEHYAAADLAEEMANPDVVQADLMASLGMRGERWTFQMRTPLEAIPPARPLLAGYRLRGYDASMSDALRQAHNAAFLDHPNFTPWSEVIGPGEDRRRRGGQDREGDPARNAPFPPHDHHVWR